MLRCLVKSVGGPLPVPAAGETLALHPCFMGSQAPNLDWPDHIETIPRTMLTSIARVADTCLTFGSPQLLFIRSPAVVTHRAADTTAIALNARRFTLVDHTARAG